MRLANVRSRGFTLIELLVVIAIIAVLISVLLPVLGAAKVEGQKAKCQASLRDICNQASIYSQEDPKSTYGPVHPRAMEFTGEGYAEYGGGPGKAPYMNWNQQFDPRTRPFNAMIYGPAGVVANTAPGDRGSFQVFQCAGEDYGWQEWPGFGGNAVEMEQSYFAANGTAFRMNNLSWTDGTIGGIYGRPVTRIPTTGATVGFMECRAFQTLFTNDNWGNLEHGQLTGYHRKLSYFMLGFCDGHVSYLNMGNGTFYPRTQQYLFKDVRGSWGRMDCMPDEFYPDSP